MALTLYGVPFSPPVRRAAVAILEKEAEYTQVPIDFQGGEHKRPPLSDKQPFKLMPLLEDDEFLIYESRAIVRYVAEKYAGQGTELLGTTLQERALVSQWLEVESQNFHPPIQGIAYQAYIGPLFGSPTDEKKLADFVEKAKTILDIYEVHLAKNEYLAGDFFSMADLSHLPVTEILWPAGQSELITSRPNVNRWWEKISSRPSWVKLASTSLIHYKP